MFKKLLYNILDDFVNFQNPGDAFERCVAEKLDRQFNEYMKEVDLLCDYLLKRDSKKVLRRVALNHKQESKNEKEEYGI